MANGPQTRSQAKQAKRALLVPAIDAWDDDEPLTELDDEDDELEEESQPPPPPPTKSKSKATAITKAGPSTGPARATRPSTQSRTRESRKKTEAQLRPYLTQPIPSSQSLSVLYDLIKSGDLDLEPDYQRDVVWTDHKQSQLIDSIYNNYPIPPIICAATVDQYGQVIRRTCIDGKQRLTSITKFMDGEIKYYNPRIKKSWYTKPKRPRATGRVMTDREQNDFKTKTFLVWEYHNITEEQEREIFQRVQLGVALTPQERLQSVNGAYANLVHKVRRRLNETNVFRNFSEWGGNRGKDYASIAQIAYLIFHATESSKDIGLTQQKLEKWLQTTSASTIQDEKLDNSLKTAFDIFFRLVHHDLYGRSITERPLEPLELVLSVYLIHHYKKRMTDSQVSDAIGVLRDQLRGQTASNSERKQVSRVFNDGLNFVIRQIGKREFKIHGDIRTLAADEPPLDPAVLEADLEEEETEEVPSALSKGKKRARTESEPVDDDAMDVDEPDAELPPAKRSKKAETRPTPQPKTAAAQQAADDDDEDSDDDTPLIKRPPPSRSTNRLSVAKPSSSAAATKIRKNKTSTSKPSPANPSQEEPSVLLQTAKSSSHPSRKRKEAAAGLAPQPNESPLTSAPPTPLPVAPPVLQTRDVEMQPPPCSSTAAVNRAPASARPNLTPKVEAMTSMPPAMSGTSSVPPLPSTGFRGSSSDRFDRMAPLRELSAAASGGSQISATPVSAPQPLQPTQPQPHPQSQPSAQTAELSVAQHKLPTPPAQDDIAPPRASGSTASMSFTQPPSRSAPAKPSVATASQPAAPPALSVSSAPPTSTGFARYAGQLPTPLSAGPSAGPSSFSSASGFNPSGSSSCSVSSMKVSATATGPSTTPNVDKLKNLKFTKHPGHLPAPGSSSAVPPLPTRPGVPGQARTTLSPATWGPSGSGSGSGGGSGGGERERELGMRMRPMPTNSTSNPRSERPLPTNRPPSPQQLTDGPAILRRVPGVPPGVRVPSHHQQQHQHQHQPTRDPRRPPQGHRPMPGR
ncbi:hypothetical protein CC1G_02718 [Coprinopsis cinerea okayama7|uniref:GmrSD restriction endonucleases N-terminal domain-containing protein n=1 Tax=Coprinopsis cinerea (strain Okayama-7 / 130 / ATCC MYA-4618 / FGSC 9003) TaxID=240176 RepID=A8PBR9_COPC7|nr:hypothetical protein CC1G_02718 [Coprinopsis cinerea okayama7\|eukprot:XP_001840255.2 hypothetical protein CC1G_02718 [Coprinopsis cinerea okayama7\